MHQLLGLSLTSTLYSKNSLIMLMQPDKTKIQSNPVTCLENFSKSLTILIVFNASTPAKRPNTTYNLKARVKKPFYERITIRNNTIKQNNEKQTHLRNLLNKNKKGCFKAKTSLVFGRGQRRL